MKRREIILASGALVALAAARVQAQFAPRRIAWLGSGTAESQGSNLVAFRAKLKELGYVEGRDVTLDIRWADGKLERTPGLAREIVASRPAVIVTGGSTAVRELKKQTSTIPVVFGALGDPVEQGIVQSLSRPGANITGVTVRTELNAKLLDLVRETLPKARRIAIPEHETEPVAKAARAAFEIVAAPLGFEIRFATVKEADELARALAQASQHKPDALLAPTFALFSIHAQQIAEWAAKSRIPVFGAFRPSAAKGGLMSYYGDTRDSYRRVGELVDKILKGANPGDLPVEQPDRFRLLINLRTAKALGIVIPPLLLARADEVIE